MRVYWIILTLLSVATLPSQASHENHPAGARSSGMAHASVMLMDFWSFHHNQAGLPFLGRMAVGFYHQSGFVREMNHQALALVIPDDRGAVAGSFSYYGYEHYHESKIAIAYGRYLAKNLTAGVQIDYFQTRITGVYGRSHQVTFEAGLLFQVSENFRAAAHVFNPVRQGVGQGEERIPTLFRFGAGYLVSENLLLCLEAEKDLERPLTPKAAMEYKLVPLLFLRAGVSLNPLQHAFGVGYTWKDLQVDAAFSFHPLLGSVPNFSLTYAF